MVKFYCESCKKPQPIIIEPMTKDDLNGAKIWGDICCVKCHLVLNTVSVDEEGVYEFVKVADKGD